MDKRTVRKINADRAWRAHVYNVCRIRQDFTGVLLSIIPIAINWYLSEFYGQFEYIMFTLIFVYCGVYMILARRNYFFEVWKERHYKREDN